MSTTYYDKNGVPIQEGDMVRCFHFRDRFRGGKHRYLYHVAVMHEGHLEMVPVSHLVASKVKDGGRYWLNQQMADCVEVIFGYGPGPTMYYDERPRREVVAEPQE